MSLRGTRFNLICDIICGVVLSEKKIKVPTTGVYDFERLILDSRGKYVDKTRLLYELASDADQQLFISRPRRFGKSLMLSTLSAKSIIRDVSIFASAVAGKVQVGT